ncbi:MAG: cardiolipin synthase [Desulfovibrionales bacterium]
MQFFDWLTLILAVLISGAGAAHALLNKRDPRAALGWIVVCLLFPPVGAFLYFLFGINRVRTQARKLSPMHPADLKSGITDTEQILSSWNSSSEINAAFAPVSRLSASVSKRPLLPGNQVRVLANGEQVFPAMLDAIKQASHKVYLSTYIFETNRTGKEFIQELALARKRGVDVRVLLDGIGELYSFPRVSWLLQKESIPVGKFLPPKLFPPSVHINLRNHRKLLVVDGQRGFTGGINIGDRHLVDLDKPGRVQDLHFMFSGPIVLEMEQVFLADWGVSTGEYESALSNVSSKIGQSQCRVLVDGPDEDLDKLAMVLVGAVSAARARIKIMTPYFLPSRELIGALQAASLRGVEVTIILPEKNNLPYVKWASNNMLWELLKEDVRIFFQPPPFNHSKLFLIDDFYTLVGSANLDPRSLRLNFEVAVEVFDPELAAKLDVHFQTILSRSRQTSLSEMDGRSLPVRLRDSVCWLFMPYL